VQDEVGIKDVDESFLLKINQQTAPDSVSILQELREKPLDARRRDELLELLRLARRQEEKRIEELRRPQEEVTLGEESLLVPDRDILRPDTSRPGETVLPRPDRDKDTGISSELQRLLDESGRIGRGRVRGEEYGRGGADAGRAGPGSGGGLDVLGGAEEDLLASRVRERVERRRGGAGLQPEAISQRGLGEPYSVDAQSPSEVRGLSRRDRAKAILGEHESFASYAEAKYHQHLRGGEVYLKQGRYYRSADAYTMASVYDAKSPLAYAGKSHALFAAGEYMSSALFISRAVEVFPEYVGRLKAGGGETAGAELDLFKLFAPSLMVIGRDKLESRAADVELWQQKSDSAELQFLLSYVYYQMGRPGRAKEAIKKASEKMPDSPAVSVLKKAIESGGQF
jgi:tetratricopeptide (TPR) repeat protein